LEKIHKILSVEIAKYDFSLWLHYLIEETFLEINHKKHRESLAYNGLKVKNGKSSNKRFWKYC